VSMRGTSCCVCRIEAVLFEIIGVKMPCSRNCSIFDIWRREDVKGERRIIGSKRRAEGFLRLETRAEFGEREDIVGAAWRERVLPR